jgi:hypothetical protein
MNECPTIRPDFYVVPKEDMAQLVRKTNDDYFNKEHKKKN